MPKIYVIHENDAWVEPLRIAFAQLGLPYVEWHLNEGLLDLTKSPPSGVFYNRMSASSHTRGHRFAPEYTAAVLSWLESHGRRVVNGRRALQLEVSKIEQYEALCQFGIRVPRTVAAAGRDHIVKAAVGISGSFITKHNRGGSGRGVRLFDSVDGLRAYVDGLDFDEPIDGITLVQEYIRAPEPFIIRCEFIGGRFFYAVRVNTSDGFELCPADTCAKDDGVATYQGPRFQILDALTNPDLERYAKFLVANDIQVAGIEFIADAKGRTYTYDVNTNTNYNAGAEAVAGRFAMRELARYLGCELARAEKWEPGFALCQEAPAS